MAATVSSFRDPENFAIELSGAWYRVASARSAKALHKLLASPLKQELVTSGSLVDFSSLSSDEESRIRQDIAVNSTRAIAKDAEVFSVETIPVITYPWEWPNRMLAAAGELTLRIRNQLLNIGLDLKDASALNIQFRGSTPLLIDVGSVELWRPNPSWNASRQFIEQFINPLAVGSSKSVSSADAWLLSNYRGVKTEVARSLMPSSLKRRPGLALLQATTRPVKSNKPSETKYADQARQDPELALRATRSLTKRLSKAVANLDAGIHETTWAGYGTRDHYQSEDLNRKYELTRAFIAADPSRSTLVLDIGGNDGLIGSRLADELDAHVVVMDSDSGALDALATRLGISSQKITPWVGDMTNPFPASGLLNQEFVALTDRLKPTAVLCQAVLHHIVISQGVPMQLAVDALASFNAPVQIEFVTPDDEKVKLLLSQIPNWSGDYSTQALIDALKTRYGSVRENGITSPTRIVITAE